MTVTLPTHEEVACRANGAAAVPIVALAAGALGTFLRWRARPEHADAAVAAVAAALRERQYQLPDIRPF